MQISRHVNDAEANEEKEFMICVQNEDGTERKTFIGKDCGEQLLEYLPDGCISYFHNLGFDGRLLMKYGVRRNIMKGNRIINQTQTYKGITIVLRDSYSMFIQKLAFFHKCIPNEFKGLNIQKELFPYLYYNHEHVFASEKPVGVI